MYNLLYSNVPKLCKVYSYKGGLLIYCELHTVIRLILVSTLF